MKREPRLFAPLLTIAALTCAAVAVWSSTEAANTYVGVKKCSMCHRSKTVGDQFGIWQSTAHAQAYAVLASEKAKAAAKNLGIADPQKSADCLKCHVTAFDAKTGAAMDALTLEEGVSCESCHGPGSAYSTMTTMKGITAGQLKADAVGLTYPPTEATCKNCHVAKGNPFYVEFKFDEAKKKIAHPRPAKATSSP